MTQAEELRIWRKILGIDPTVKQVFKYLKQFSMMNRVIKLRVINRFLGDPDQFQRSLIASHDPEVTTLFRWLLKEEARKDIMRRVSSWILRAGFGERIMEEMMIGKPSRT